MSKNKVKTTIKFDDQKQVELEVQKEAEQQQQQALAQKKKEKEQKKKDQIAKAQSVEQYSNITIAIPDSIVQNAQSSELRSYFMSQLARMFAIFKVDHVIILRDYSYICKSSSFDSAAYIARNLQYLESPQYLRKHLFPIHSDLKNVGLMNPIESKHHLKHDEICEFREGVVVDRPTKDETSCWVEIGLRQQVQIPFSLKSGTRVTLKLDDPHATKLSGQPVSNKEVKDAGIYWGYQVTIESKLHRLFAGKYDTKILLESQSLTNGQFDDFSQFNPEEYQNKNMLIVFSGYNSLSSLVENDEKSKIKSEELFDYFDHIYRFNNDNYGVKNLRLEEQIQMFLQKYRSL